jgi:hypothetical protein
MRFPRPRITVRRMMILVAVVAIALVTLVPVASRLYWLYNTPLSVNLVLANVHPVRVKLEKPSPVGKPVQVRCPYDIIVTRPVPTGVPYQVLVQVKLIRGDLGPAGVVEVMHQQTHRIWGGSKGIRGELRSALVPSAPGAYTIRYEAHITDLFGRRGMSGCDTDWFEAR